MKAHVFAFCSCLINTPANAEGIDVEAYFSNDSVNGFQLSDAYETHNMGIRVSNETYYAVLDLGVVSPDMYVYRNRFREANRSFGELITLEIGQTVSQPNEPFFYGRVKASGRFGIDGMQDFAHKVLSLQPVNEVNDLVRMPDNVWYGIGGVYKLKAPDYIANTTEITIDAYLGTDAAYTQAEVSSNVTGDVLNFSYGAGVRFVAYDEVVNADPINAEIRIVNPYAYLGLDFQVAGYKLYFKEVISYPTIKSDDALYAVLNAGISFEF
jgi:hypothetical protein